MASNGDIVLVYQDENPGFFARIEDIWADHKPGWFQVKLLVFQIPVVEVVWILREAYIHGEIFTMNGRTMKLELIRRPSQSPLPPIDQEGGGMKKQRHPQGKVISLFDRKRE